MHVAWIQLWSWEIRSSMVHREAQGGKEKRGMKWILSQNLQKESTLLISWFWTCGPSRLKEYIYVVVSYLACDRLIQQLLESNMACNSYKQRHNIVIKIKELILIHHRILVHSVIPTDAATYVKAEDPLPFVSCFLKLLNLEPHFLAFPWLSWPLTILNSTVTNIL